MTNRRGPSSATVEHDRDLQRRQRNVVRQGDHVDESLGRLRYKACCVGGITYESYGEAVGISRQAVYGSVRRYLARHPELVPASKGRSRLSCQDDSDEADTQIPEVDAVDGLERAVSELAALWSL
ncbi:MAG: hypothetical protein ACLPVY_21860 [Acidimicrobiia bacterium]